MQFCSNHRSSINKVLTNACLLLMTWAVPWSIFGEECLPGGSIFGLVILFDCSILAGAVVHAIPIPGLPPLPRLLGMLLAGFALRNIPNINFAKDIDPNWSSAIRSLALTVILVKAGLELDAAALKTMKGVCLRLTALPCLAETVACAVASFLLLGFSWEWGILLGFVLGAVTPAVIVPTLLMMQEKRLGVAQGIPTLVIAASSFDDVVAISGFSVVLGIIFSPTTNVPPGVEIVNKTANDILFTPDPLSVTALAAEDSAGSTPGEVALMVLRGPLEMLGGIVIGVVIGVILWHIPDVEQTQATMKRSLIVFGVGILAVFGTRTAGFPGAGAIIAIVTPFVAAFRWKESKNPISENMGVLWIAFEPLMFGLIGAEISIDKMDANTVGFGIIVVLFGLIFRSLTTFAAVFGSGFTFKEKIFICLAWLPKATVQAAIGPLALDTARERNAPESVKNTAQQVLTIAVLSILLTAPLGAAAVALSGPKLLRKCDDDDNDDERTHPMTSMPSSRHGSNSSRLAEDKSPVLEHEESYPEAAL